MKYVSSGKPVEFEKALDYSMVYADGAIFQLTNNAPRIIFYQEHVELDEDGSTIAKDKRKVKLRFEVRMPPNVTEHLAEAISLASELYKAANKISRNKIKNDKCMAQSLSNFNSK